jgi:uncharacterized protein YbaP (TraB family)
MRTFMAAAATVLALTATPAAGQVVADPEANLVEELVVQALEPGPAWWRVKDGDTTVYILGIAEDAAPADVAWDRRALERRLDGANSLIVGTRIGLTGGLRDIPALLRARSQLKSKTPLEQTLPDPLRARFVQARTQIGQGPGRYAEWTPLVAGMRLVEDSQPKRTTTSVTALALKLAKSEKVKPVYPARYKAVPFMQRAFAGLTPAVHHQCLDAAIEDARAPAARKRAAVEAWARGDTPSALTEPRSFEKCLLILGGGAEFWTQVVGDQAGAIERALQTPGHSVALVSLRPLLAEGGVLDRLRARGVRVAGPGEGD